MKASDIKLKVVLKMKGQEISEIHDQVSVWGSELDSTTRIIFRAVGDGNDQCPIWVEGIRFLCESGNFSKDIQFEKPLSVRSGKGVWVSFKFESGQATAGEHEESETEALKDLLSRLYIAGYGSD